jgi:Phosphorylase superfamily
VNKTSFILECALDREILAGRGISVTEAQATNRFGTIASLRLDDGRGNSARVYEYSGVDQSRSFADSHLPLFTDVYLSGDKNVFLLGYCGSLDGAIGMNSLVIPRDFIDLTRNRPRSYLEALPGGSKTFYYSMKDPYAPTLVADLTAVASEIGSRVHPVDDYVVTEGPRFESVAEIRFCRLLGSRAVCFSGMPDACFCRELDLNLALGLYVSNMAEGVAGAFQALADVPAQTRDISRLVAGLMTRDIGEDTDAGHHRAHWVGRPNPATYLLIR